MPVAEHFSTEGRENGFPFCTEKYDMTSGTDNPQAFDYVAWSLEEAMKLFWNFYSIGVTLRSSITPNPPDPQFAEVIDDTDPILRVCRSQSPEIVQYPLFLEGNPMVKLYSGSTDDESNFEGYAFGRPDIASGIKIFVAIDPGVGVYDVAILSSYSKNYAPYGTPTLTTIGGIDFYQYRQGATEFTSDAIEFYTY
jgi:hypothetical protein